MVKVAAIGDNVVDCYLANGMMYPGGNTLNVAVYVQRFGGQATYVGAIGRDSAGKHILQALKQEGVDLSHLHVLDGASAYCVIGNRNGDRIFVTFDLGVSIFKPTKRDIQHLKKFDAAHVGKSSQLDQHLEAIAAGTRLSYDFATSRDVDHIDRVAPLCYLATFSGGDLEASEADDLIDRMLKAGARWALVTRGSNGARLGGSSGIHSVPATPVQVVDTLGAGDAFIARTLYGLLGGEAPEVLLRAAADAAADVCCSLGAFGYETPIDVAADLSNLRAPV